MTIAFDLPIARYQFELLAQTPLSFPAYAGSTWRGAFGRALRRSVCVTRQPQCEGCLLQRHCVYSQIFETPAGAEPLLSKGNAAPRPYLLHPLSTSGQSYQVGDALRIQLTLLGQSLSYLPYLIHSMQQMGEQGIGAKQGRFDLLTVWIEKNLGAEDWVQTYLKEEGRLQRPLSTQVLIPAAPKAVRLVFKTAFRAQQGGRFMHETVFDLPSFMMGLVRRLSLLSAYHGHERLAVDFKALRTQAQALVAQDIEFKRFAWTRYSSRQQCFIDMDGLLGGFSLSGEAWQVFWPWLWWGQWVHVGKGAVMGQGQYQLELMA